MTLPILDAEQLYFATLAGCHAVVRERDTLNAINVFPVQDGDTGDNMAATANAIIHHASLEASIKETLQSVANASMSGARGNSGMIFSQFFNALADGIQEEDALTVQRFGELLNLAAQRVRKAILNPMDGTMLTIMEHWSQYTHEHGSQISCFKSLLDLITQQLQGVVSQTTQTLAALKQAGVVDAGALGFFHFVNGFSRFISDPSTLPSMQSLPDIPLTQHSEECGHEHPQNGRYCTEAMIHAPKLPQDELMNLLKPFGDSIVISANQQRCRFHLHTDTPWLVFEKLNAIGQIQHPKVDDMLRQFQTIHQREHAIALVTDSNIDLPAAFIDQHQIHQIPLNVHIEQHDLLDKFTISPEHFYRSLNTYATHPKTSCPSHNAIEQKLRPLSEKYEHVIVLTLAEALSGTHNAIKIVAEKYDNISVVDSKLCSAGQGLILAKAAEALPKHHSPESVIAEIQRVIPYTHCWFMADDLTALIRSGRINKLIGKMAQFSGVRPLFSITPEGKTQLETKALSQASILQKIFLGIEAKQEAGLILERYAIVHADALDVAEKFAKTATRILNLAPDYIEPVSVSIGVHTGRGCIGLAAIFKPAAP